MCVKCIWVPFHVGLRHNATANLLAKDAWRLPPHGDDRMVMTLRRRRDTERPHSININHQSVCATSKSTVAGVLCFGGTTLSRRVWGWATVRRGGLSRWRGSLPLRSVACAAHRLPTPSSTTAWRVLLFDTSYSMVCRCMLSVIIFWSPIFSMRFSDVTLDLVAFPDTLLSTSHLLLFCECELVGGVREWVSV